MSRRAAAGPAAQATGWTAGAVALALALGAAAAVAAGCGLGAGEGPDRVSLTVTRDFGARVLGSATQPQARGGETVMRFLQRRFEVRTRYGGGFVQSIDGLAGGVSAGRRIDWFYYVNGVEAHRGAATTPLRSGDRVWWDRHDWGAAISIPAVVGSFPEPFRSGTGGRRAPVTVVCAPGAKPACDEVERRLAAVGVAAGQGAVGGVRPPQTLRVLVGPWPALRGDPAVGRLERGPAASGVYARPHPAGATLALLDERGRPVRRLGTGSGLVAATRLPGQQPTWVVTGSDPGGVMSAARRLTAHDLAHRFALAVAGRGEVPLPARPAAGGGA